MRQQGISMRRSGFIGLRTAAFLLTITAAFSSFAQPQTSEIRRMATPAQTPTSEQMDQLTGKGSGAASPTRRTPPIPFPSTPTPTPAPTPLSHEGLEALFFPRELNANLPSVMSILYSGTRRAMIDPCGCHAKQLGGIDKEARLDKELDARNVPTVKVDAGGFLKEIINDAEIERAKVLFKALGMLKYDVLNVGYVDLSVGAARLKEMADTAGLKLVSANIADSSGKLAFDPYEVRDIKLRSGEQVRVGIIGVTRSRFPQGAAAAHTPAIGTMPISQRSTSPAGKPTAAGRQMPPGRPNMPSGNSVPGKTIDAATSRALSMASPTAWPGEDVPEKGLGAEAGTTSTAAETYEPGKPLDALKKYLPELKQKADIIILLDYANRDELKALLSELGSDATKVNVAVAAEFNPAQSNVETIGGTLVVSGAWEGKNIGHLMLDIADKKIRANAHRYIDVEQTIPSVPEFTKLMDDYKDAMKAKFAAPTPAPSRVTLETR